MTANKNADEQARLQAELGALLEDYAALSDEAIKGVVNDILVERRRALEQSSAGERRSSGWTNRINSNVVSPLFPSQFSLPGAGELGSVQIDVENEGAINSVLHQVLEVGALLIQLDPRPQLNDVLMVALRFPDHHLALETEGRVVNISDRGIAIEVSGLGREDRLALQAIREEMERAAAREEEGEDGPPPASLTYEGMGALVVEGTERLDRSFKNSVTATRGASVKMTHTGPHRKMVRSTTQRTVELPAPDIHVMQPGIAREGMSDASEVYGPAPPLIEPIGEADRIEALASDRLLDILLQLSANGFTGMMELKRPSGQREQWCFDGGLIVERSREPRRTEEELGPMLLAADRIDRRDLAMAAAHADELNMNVARSLLNLDIMNPEALRQAIAGRLTFLVRELCGVEQGQVSLYAAEALPAGFLPQPPLRVHVAVERIIFERLFRRLEQMPASQRDEHLSEVLDTYPEVLEEERPRLERALVEQGHIQLVERGMNGRKRMREALTESALSPGESFAVIFSLHRMGLIRFDRSLHDTVVRERLRENITVKHLSVHKASYFEVLNVHWSSYSEVIAEAYERLKEQFDPAGIPEALEEGVHQKVAEINERLEAAYAALAKRETRHAYRKRIMPEYKLDHAIPLFLKQAELARRRQQWRNARDSLCRVLELEPGHGEAESYLTVVEAEISGEPLGNPDETFD